MANYIIKMNITYYLEWILLIYLLPLSNRIIEHSFYQNSLFSSYEGNVTHVRMQQSLIGFALKSNQY